MFGWGIEAGFHVGISTIFFADTKDAAAAAAETLILHRHVISHN